MNLEASYDMRMKELMQRHTDYQVKQLVLMYVYDNGDGVLRTQQIINATDVGSALRMISTLEKSAFEGVLLSDSVTRGDVVAN